MTTCLLGWARLNSLEKYGSRAGLEFPRQDIYKRRYWTLSLMLANDLFLNYSHFPDPDGPIMPSTDPSWAVPDIPDRIFFPDGLMQKLTSLNLTSRPTLWDDSFKTGSSSCLCSSKRGTGSVSMFSTSILALKCFRSHGHSHRQSNITSSRMQHRTPTKCSSFMLPVGQIDSGRHINGSTEPRGQ